MKPLRVKSQKGAKVSAEDETLSGLTFSTSPLATRSPVASLEPSRSAAKELGLSSRQMQEAHELSNAAMSPPTTALSAAAPATGKVRFSSELDSAAMGGYLEYLTRPHTSWSSASRYVAQRHKVIEEHRGSVYARSLACSRRSSFASTVQSEGSCFDALEASMSSSVASAPAGFPRTSLNGSKTSTGILRKGRLGEVRPPLPSSEAAEPLSIAARSSSVVSSSHGASLTSCTSRGTEHRSSSIKGRLSRCTARSGSLRPLKTSSTAKRSTDLDKGGLTIGGTQLQSSSANLFLVNGHGSAVTSRTAARACGNILRPLATQEGVKSVPDPGRPGDLRAVVPPPQPKQRLM